MQRVGGKESEYGSGGTDTAAAVADPPTPRILPRGLLSALTVTSFPM